MVWEPCDSCFVILAVLVVEVVVVGGGGGGAVGVVAVAVALFCYYSSVIPVGFVDKERLCVNSKWQEVKRKDECYNEQMHRSGVALEFLVSLRL